MFGHVKGLFMCSNRAAEDFQHGLIESRNIGRLTACYPVIIFHDFLIYPIAPGVTDVVLDRVVAGQGSPANQAGGNKCPWRVTDSGNRFIVFIHFLQERLHFGHHP